MHTTRKQAVYALVVICAANFLNYLDRTVVSTLEHPIRTSFHMSGSEFGLLWTLFTVGYMCFAPFIGFFTDRYKRTRLLAFCILIWSLATIGSGLAPTKPLLYVSRILIGVGEAGCLIIGPTLISDYFPKEQRGRALSIFFLGLPLGGTAGYVIGGTFAEHAFWRNAFYFAGIPGLGLTVVVWMLADPPRGTSEGAGHGVKIQGIRPYLSLFKIPTFLLLVLAQAFAVLFLVPLLHFGSGFFQEFRGMKAQEASITLGFMALIGGGLGSAVSGILGDKLSKRNKGAYSLMAGIGFLAGLPCILGGLYFTPKWIYLPLLMLVCFFYFLCMPAVNTQIANVTHPTQRAMAYALAVFVLHLLGDTLAPPVFGGVSDALTRNRDPVAIDRVHVLLPSGPAAKSRIQAACYERHAIGSHNPGEHWIDIDGSTVVRTTRVRYVQEAGGGPPAHPNQARVAELHVSSEGKIRPPLRAEVDSGNQAYRLIDSDPSTVWVSTDSKQEHFASVVFGAPGTGRRLAFTIFSFTMVAAGLLCLLAARFAARDAAKVTEDITRRRKADSTP